MIIKNFIAQTKLNYGLILLLLLSAKVVWGSEGLTLDNYKRAVATKSLKISSLNDEIQGAVLEDKQGEYLTSPQSFIDYQDSKDKSPSLAPGSSGTERNGDEMKVGVQAQTKIGLKPRLFAFTQNQQVFNISYLSTPNLSLNRRGYGVEAEIALWKNGFGKDLRGQIANLKAVSDSKRYQAEAAKVAFEVEAEVLYFETAYIKQAILIQEDLVLQGERLVSWAKKQSANRLIESVHVAQATAAYQSRKLALISMRQQLRTNLLKMSQLVGQNILEDVHLDSVEAISQNTPSLSINKAEKITIKGLSSAIEAERISLELASESFKPDLNLKAQYLTYSDTGRADDTSRCKSHSDCPTFSLSVNLIVPLEFSTWNQGNKAFFARVTALTKSLEAEKQNAKIESNQLSAKVKALKDQIESLEILVEAQGQRLEKERKRQARGLATTSDLILSEQALGESKISLVEAQTKYISTLSQFKFFEVSQ